MVAFFFVRKPSFGWLGKHTTDNLNHSNSRKDINYITNLHWIVTHVNNCDHVKMDQYKILKHCHREQ